MTSYNSKYFDIFRSGDKCTFSFKDAETTGLKIGPKYNADDVAFLAFPKASHIQCDPNHWPLYWWFVLPDESLEKIGLTLDNTMADLMKKREHVELTPKEKVICAWRQLDTTDRILQSLRALDEASAAEKLEEWFGELSRDHDYSIEDVSRC